MSETRFSAFVSDNLDAIVDEWRSFARTISPATAVMTNLALEDHARDILLAIVQDMETTQSEQQRVLKSQGRAAAPLPMALTAAQTHGALRQESGFDLYEVASEFRALRASVLALWRESQDARSADTAVEEIARFNEGIDQALAESIQSHSENMAKSRDMFLAVLGHDVRGPLNGIQMAAELLSMPTLADPVRLQIALRIRRAADVIHRLTTDLLEYARSRLGSDIPIERSDCDIGVLCEEAIDILRTAHPEQAVRTEFSDQLRARVDIARLQQALGNLLNNAVQHGHAGQPISVTARRASEAIEIAVSNRGQSIPPDALERIFEPLYQLPHGQNGSSEQRSRVGLGLFIVKQIVDGHGGSVEVASSVNETVFTLWLPDAP